MKIKIMFKKVFFTFMITVILNLCIPTICLHAKQTMVNNIKYDYNPSTCTASVAIENNISGNIIIPSDITIDEINYKVTSIDSFAFNACYNLTSVNIPSTITSIDNSAFFYCTNLTNINVDPNNNYYSSDDGILYDKKKTTLICCPEGKTGSLVIPSKVISIIKYSFFNCINLTNITLPKSIVLVENDAFYGFNNLNNINMPPSEDEIETNIPTGHSFLNFGGLIRASTLENDFPRSIGTHFLDIKS